MLELFGIMVNGRMSRLVPWLPTIFVALPAALLLVLGVQPGLYYMFDFLLIVYFWLTAPLLFAIGAGLQALAMRAQTTTVTRQAQGGWWVAAVIVVVTTAAIGFKLPLRLGFLTARPGLQRLVEQSRSVSGWRMATDQRVGLYTISARHTNARRSRARSSPQCASEGRVVFVLADDAEAAFIYDTNGIENLCYNSGSKGHLMGPWYSMKED